MSIKIESSLSTTLAIPSIPTRESALILLAPPQKRTEEDLFFHYQNRFTNHAVILIKIKGQDLLADISSVITPRDLTRRSIVVLRTGEESFEYPGLKIFDAFPRAPLLTLPDAMTYRKREPVGKVPDKVIILLMGNQKYTAKTILTHYQKKFKDRNVVLIKILGWDIASEIRKAIRTQELKSQSMVILKTSETVFEYRGLSIFNYFPDQTSFPLLRDTLAAMKQEALGPINTHHPEKGRCTDLDEL